MGESGSSALADYVEAATGGRAPARDRQAELDAAAADAAGLRAALAAGPPAWLEPGAVAAARLERGAFVRDGDAGTPVAAGGPYEVRRSPEHHAAGARVTTVDPAFVEAAVRLTGLGAFAWLVSFSPERAWAVRARPADVAGKTSAEVDALAAAAASDLRAYLRRAAVGSASHRVPLADYAARLAALVDVEAGPPTAAAASAHAAGGWVRFYATDLLTPAEAAAEVAALRRLDPAALDVAGLAEVRRLTRAEPVEYFGEIEIAGGAARLLAAHRGSLGSAPATYRALVTFHTHPLARYRGRVAEVPSPADLDCLAPGLAWHVVSAPEGLYWLHRTAATPADGAARYAEAARALDGAPRATAADAVRLIRDAGYHATFAPLDDIPVGDRPAAYGLLDRAAVAAAAPAARADPDPRLAAWDIAGLAGEPFRAAPVWGDFAAPGRPPLASRAGREPLALAVGPYVVAYFPAGLPAAPPDLARLAPTVAWVVRLSPTHADAFRIGRDAGGRPAAEHLPAVERPAAGTTPAGTKTASTKPASTKPASTKPASTKPAGKKRRTAVTGGAPTMADARARLARALDLAADSPIVDFRRAPDLTPDDLARGPWAPAELARAAAAAAADLLPPAGLARLLARAPPAVAADAAVAALEAGPDYLAAFPAQEYGGDAGTAQEYGGDAGTAQEYGGAESAIGDAEAAAFVAAAAAAIEREYG